MTSSHLGDKPCNSIITVKHDGTSRETLRNDKPRNPCVSCSERHYCKVYCPVAKQYYSKENE